MKNRVLMILFIISTLVFSGCSHDTSTKDELNNELSKMIEENEVLLRDLQESSIALDNTNKLIDDLKSNELKMLSDNEDLEETISEISTTIKQRDSEIGNLEERIRDLEANILEEKTSRLEDLKVGMELDGLIVKDVIVDERRCHVSFGGYFIQEGSLSVSDAGNEYIYFAAEDESYHPFSGIENHDFFLKGFGVTNDDLLREELGDELYDRFSEELHNGNWLEVNAIAVFTDFEFNGYYESEIVNKAKIVKILEIVEMK